MKNLQKTLLPCWRWRDEVFGNREF